MHTVPIAIKLGLRPLSDREVRVVSEDFIGLCSGMFKVIKHNIDNREIYVPEPFNKPAVLFEILNGLLVLPGRAKGKTVQA